MTLDRYLLKQFVPIFTVASFLFVMLVSLMDLFANLWRYINYEVPMGQMLTVSLYYLPKSFSYALPVSLLFASAYTLGDLYGRNELTAIFSSGIPFSRFSRSLLVLGVLASLFSFYFEDRIVIPTLKTKNETARVLLHQQQETNTSNLVIRAKNGQQVYAVDYYDYANSSLNGLSIIEKDESGALVSIVRANHAAWNGEYWELSNAVMYQWDNGILRANQQPESDEYRENPEIFERSAVNVTEVSAREALILVNDLKAAGLPFTTALSDYYHRFSFASASFIVMILSISMGGRFRKNILLMTLLSSLLVAVLFYIMDMITMMMAKLGYIPPVAGAWFPVLFFIVAGVFLLQSAKT
ncbi:membrane protein [Spirochaetia bacterium]|nr:membrane protein [Spirochaetia bacterium]